MNPGAAAFALNMAKIDATKQTVQESAPTTSVPQVPRGT
jgi:hypothetical protein